MVIRSKQRLKISKPFNIVLVNPEIPPNTGNIARLCAATNTKLHLVHPLGFKTTDKELKRAGLDYWHLLDIEEHDSWEKFMAKRHCEEPPRFARGKLRDEAISKRNEIAASAHSVPPRNDNITNFWYMSTRGEKNIWNADFNPGDFLFLEVKQKVLVEKF